MIWKVVAAVAMVAAAGTVGYLLGFARGRGTSRRMLNAALERASSGIRV